MTTESLPESLLQTIRDHRSSESNFEVISQTLRAALRMAEENNHSSLAHSLKEIEEKYGTEYQKAKETGGSAWPEFENYVTQLERELTAAQKAGS